ncbi:MAG TPA: hypothetical protein VIY73_29340 [Polyangiaceae bacterium]
MTCLRHLALLSSSALLACSSSSQGNASGYDGATGAAFSAYCTGTLLQSEQLMSEGGGGSWEGDGALSAASGTPFLLASNVSAWDGYVIAGDGTPYEVQASGFPSGLVEGTDFSASCAPTGGPSSTSFFVLLGATTLYPNADFSGTPCTLPAGTQLTNASFSASGSDPTSGAQLSADELSSKCGVAGIMYGKEIPFADLFAK